MIGGPSRRVNRRVDESVRFRGNGHLATPAVISKSGNDLETKGATMFDELTEELLDLTTTVRGYGGAMYAVVDDPGCSSGVCSSVILCCTCTTLCW